MDERVFMRFLGGKAKALTLSYDDGVEQDVGVMFGGSNYLRLYFAQSGMNVEEIKFVNTVDFSKERPHF